MARYFIILLIISVISATNAAKNHCEKPYGEFADEIQCDKYYSCEDGVETVKYCPDGLVFDPHARKINKCDSIFNVDCEDRQELQPPQPKGEYCPRKNGYYAHPDSSVCNIFYNCIDGEGTKMTCTTGLHFDENSGTCVWPQHIDRQGCAVIGKKLNDGFECPKVRQIDSRGMLVDHPKYAHPDDCQKFYVCLNGETPREQGCSEGTVYNEEEKKCDAPENVPGCENWYKDDGKP